MMDCDLTDGPAAPCGPGAPGGPGLAAAISPSKVARSLLCADITSLVSNTLSGAFSGWVFVLI